MLKLVTRFGDMDLVFSPAGELTGYDPWFVRSRPARLRERLVVAVADLDAIISSKVAREPSEGPAGAAVPRVVA